MELHMEVEAAKAGDVSTGTTILACEYEGGVVLAADSRTSTGIYVANRVSDKIVSLADNIYVCRSGSAADTQTICDYARKFLADYAIQKGRKPNVSVAAHLLSSIVYNNKDKLSAGLIVAGVDDKAGPQVYAIPLGGTLVRQPLAVGGSGSVFIHSLGDDQYDPRMTGDDAQAFAKKMVSHAMSRDGSSGGVIRTVVMDADGAKRSFWSGADLPFTIEGGTDDLAAALAEARHEGASAAAAASSSSSAAAAVRT